MPTSFIHMIPPTPGLTSTNLSANIYFTLQLLSVQLAANCSPTCSLTRVFGFKPSAMAIKSGIVRSRTESWSSEARRLYNGMISLIRMVESVEVEMMDLANG